MLIHKDTKEDKKQFKGPLMNQDNNGHSRGEPKLVFPLK